MTKVDEVLDSIGSMTVLELSELLTAFEEKFGVTAAAPMAMAAPVALAGAAAQDGQSDEAEEEKPNLMWRFPLSVKRKSKSSRNCVLSPALV